MWLFKRIWMSGVIYFDIVSAAFFEVCIHTLGIWTDYDNWKVQYDEMMAAVEAEENKE
jgi:hypothetical protein